MEHPEQTEPPAEPVHAPDAPEEVTGAEQAPVAEPAAVAGPEAEAEAEGPDYLALAQRLQADFDNFRKRAQRDQAAAEQRGVMKVVRELLPALDNLDRALAAAEAQPDGAEHHLAEGFRLVQAELVAAFTRVGVEAYSPQGEPFDPNVHEAMAQQPVEGAESGTVVQVYQAGWRKDGTVIRPARVVVAA